MLVLSTIPVLVSAQATKIDVNINHKHSVGGIDSLDRSKFITIHADQTESEWDGNNSVGDLRDDFLNGRDVFMGRNTGQISWNLNRINEDPARLGFANPADIALYGGQTRASYSTNSTYKSFEGRNDLVIAAQLHPFYPDGQLTGTGWAFSQENKDNDQFGFATGEYMGRFIQEFHGSDGQPRPLWIEVVNEPMWHLWDEAGKHSPEEIFRFHNGAAAGIRSILGNDIPIGGYCTAFPNFEEDNFDRWRNRWKLFMDMVGPNMDFWSIHLYDWPAWGGGNQLYRKGSNIEATLDMMEQYSLLSQGEVKPIMVSEYGAMAHDYLYDLWTPYRDWLQTKSLSSMMMSFMERPNIINKAIPFVVVKGEWGRVNGVPYNHRLMRQAKEGEGETGDQWVYTDMVYFYDLWKDVKGKRVDTKSLDLDFQVDAYVDGSTVCVIVNNLYFEDKSVQLNMFDRHANTLNSIDVKHYHLSGSKSVLDETVLSGVEMSQPLSIGAEGTLVLKYNYAAPVILDESKVETKYYADTYLQEIFANQEIIFNINNVTTANIGESSLRLALGRDHGKSKRPILKFNGTDVTVPFNFRGGDQADRGSFYGVIEVQIPNELIQVNNTVSLTFGDDGGHVASVTMRLFNYSSAPSRSPGDPVTGVSVQPSTKTLLIGSTIQLNETIEPATAENIKVTWTSDNPAVASVDAYGLVTAVAIGTANITVTTDDGGHTATSAIQVTDQLPNMVSCELLPASGIESQSNYQFQIPYSSNSDQKVFVDVRKVVNGSPVAQWQGGAEVIVGVGTGTLDVNVFMQTLQIPGDSVRLAVWIQPIDGTWLDATDACNVFTKVLGKVDVTSVSINESIDSLDMGDVQQLTATILPADATNPAVTWTSSNPTIATVSSNGLINAILPGEVTITLSSDDNSTLTDALDLVVSDTTEIISGLSSELEHTSVYPNPASSKIILTNLPKGLVSIQFIDQMGRVIVDQKLNNDHEMDISFLDPGVFIVILNDGLAQRRFKLVKK